MAITFGIPRPESRLTSPDGTISREWYLFLSMLLQYLGGPAVGPGGGASPIDNQMQFEEYPLSIPDAQEALHGVDELRNAIELNRNDAQIIRGLYDELSSTFAEIRNSIDLRSRVDDVESFIEAQRPSTLFPTVEQFIAPSFQNSWANFGGAYNPAGYYKDPFGIVHLRGLVVGGTVGSPIFTLPLGYRPANSEVFVAISNSTIGYFTLTNTGALTLTTGSNVFASLDGITFRAA